MRGSEWSKPYKSLSQNIPNSRRVEKCYDFASCKTWQLRSRALKLRRCLSDIFRRVSSYLFSFSVRSGSSYAGSLAGNGRSTSNTTTDGSCLFSASTFSGSASRTRPRRRFQISNFKFQIQQRLQSRLLRCSCFCQFVFLKLRTQNGDCSPGFTRRPSSR